MRSQARTREGGHTCCSEKSFISSNSCVPLFSPVKREFSPSLRHQIRLRNIPEQTNSTCLFLERRVAAHGPKGNLNLSYEALSQSFFRQVLQICTPAPTSQKPTKPLFSRTFRGPVICYAGISRNPHEVRFSTSPSDDPWIRGDAMNASNRSKPAPAVPDFAPHGIRPAAQAQKREDTELAIKIPPLWVAELVTGEENKPAAGSAERSGAVRPSQGIAGCLTHYDSRAQFRFKDVASWPSRDVGSRIVSNRSQRRENRRKYAFFSAPCCLGHLATRLSLTLTESGSCRQSRRSRSLQVCRRNRQGR